MKSWQKAHSILGFVLMLALLLFAPEPSLATCKNSGGSTGGNAVGSQVSGAVVTICASAVAVSPARTAEVKIKPILKIKSAPVIFRRTQTQMQPRPIPGASVTKPKPAVKKPVVKKPAVTTLVSSAGSTSKSAATADFTPARTVASVFPSDQLVLGETAFFSASANQHFQVGTILNLPTEVRFTPTAIDWIFSDQRLRSAGEGRGASVSHAFSSAGVHEVQVMATYAVSYRVKGSVSWIPEPESISLIDVITVTVSAESEQPAAAETEKNPRKKVRLVASDCLKRPGSFGCD